MTRIFTMPIPKDGRGADFINSLLGGALDGLHENARQSAKVRITSDGISVYVTDYYVR